MLQNGVYTACEPCANDPKKPPLWQVQAARIIHDQSEKMLYFEDARVEFFGVPLAWVPFMSAPDPTVKRKSGFLFPTVSDTTQYGFGVEVPYYWALAPNYDLTVSTMATTRQGELFQGEWRHRLMDGAYSIKAAGIFQQDPGYFAARDGVNSPTAASFRGAVQTAGQFGLGDHWVWGWTGILVTDSQFLNDYRRSQFTQSFDPFLTGIAAEGVSQVYLTGTGDRSYFDIRSIYYYGFSQLDVQSQLPVIHPVLDYSNVLAQQVAGGEFSYKINLTSLNRQEASFDAISQTAVNNGSCVSNTADTAVLIRSNCLLRGIPGDYSRFSAETDWRRTLVTYNGQEITPFFRLRGDFAALNIDNQPGVANYIATGQSDLARVMPTAGVEYRYPLVDVEPWGTQTIEPIAQLIVRPNETQIGKFPNEDAQSLVFDDSNLFKVDKFSGWDRAEGGGRANLGFQYTAQINRAGSVNVMFGEFVSAVRHEFVLRRRQRYHQYRTEQRPRQDRVGLCRTRHLSAELGLLVHRARALRRTNLRGRAFRGGKPRQFRPLDAAGAIRQLRAATGTRLPVPASGRPRRRFVQAHGELDSARLGALRSLRQRNRSIAARYRLYRRLLPFLGELAHRLHLYGDIGPGEEQHIHGANELAHARPRYLESGGSRILNFAASWYDLLLPGLGKAEGASRQEAGR